mgnify:CR=1 FL=1
MLTPVADATVLPSDDNFRFVIVTYFRFYVADFLFSRRGSLRSLGWEVRVSLSLSQAFGFCRAAGYRPQCVKCSPTGP